MRTVKGFTLVELMVTIAVLAIILSMAVPSFRNIVISTRLNTVANEIADVMSYARSEAVKRNRVVTFCTATTATATSCGAPGTSWVHWIVLAGGEVVRRGEVSRYGATINVSSALVNSRIAFGGDGLARTGTGLVTDTNGRITVCAVSGPAESVRRVTVGAGSRISIERLAGAC